VDDLIMKKSNLLEGIEKLRAKLNGLMYKKGEVDKQVITISKKLDNLLNKYENMVR
jgi:hypothetical protein